MATGLLYELLTGSRFKLALDKTFNGNVSKALKILVNWNLIKKEVPSRNYSLQPGDAIYYAINTEKIYPHTYKAWESFYLKQAIQNTKDREIWQFLR